MGLLRHFDYTPDNAESNVRFELRNQEPHDDAEARVALTVVDLESNGDDDQGKLTVELSPRDIEGLIEALEQTLDELEPSGGDEDEEAADEAEPQEAEPQQTSRRTRSKEPAKEEASAEGDAGDAG